MLLPQNSSGAEPALNTPPPYNYSNSLYDIPEHPSCGFNSSSCVRSAHILFTETSKTSGSGGDTVGGVKSLSFCSQQNRSFVRSPGLPVGATSGRQFRSHLLRTRADDEQVSGQLLSGVWTRDGRQGQLRVPQASVLRSLLERPCHQVLQEPLLPA